MQINSSNLFPEYEMWRVPRHTTEDRSFYIDILWIVKAAWNVV